MKYFIGIQLPESYRKRIENVRDKFNFNSTIPHITIIAPPLLPEDDIFIKDLIDVCSHIEPFEVNLTGLNNFSDRVLYIDMNSDEIINLNKAIREGLNLEEPNKKFIPHLTIVKKRAGRYIDINKARVMSEKYLLPAPKLKVDSIVVYQQPKERSAYRPYIQIPLNK